MSSYHLNRLLFDLKMNESVLKRASENLPAVMAEYDLTAEEKAALTSRCRKQSAGQNLFQFGPDFSGGGLRGEA